MEVVIYIIVFIIVAGLTMVVTHIIYDLAALILPVLALLMVVVGILFGGGVAVRNTFSSYKKVYFKKRTRRVWKGS